MDPFDLLDPVDIVSQLPGSLYTQLESKKWTDRKEALEIVEKVTAVPKIHNADFSELVKALKKTIAKDSNIVVATLAAKCLSQLARGLGPNFNQYSSVTLPVLFEKFKEKKSNVISVMRDAADAVFAGTNIEAKMEDITAFLNNKNPQIRAEMELFLARVFARYPAQVVNKKTLRPLINALIKNLSDMDSSVRDGAAMAIGTAMKVTGEKLMMTLIADVEPIKIPKIKEFCDKAELVVETQPQMTTNNIAVEPIQPVPVAADLFEEQAEEDPYEFLEAVDITGQIPGNFHTQVESKKWTDRKETLEMIEKATAVPKIENADFSELVQALRKIIAKDSNIVVATLAAKCICQLSKGLGPNFSQYSNATLPILFEKFKEKKSNVISVMRDAADAVFAGTNIEAKMEDITTFLNNKNPQIRAEMELFLARSFSRFPSQVTNKKTLRPLINALIKNLSDMDSSVRDGAAMAIGTAMKVTGEKLMMTLIADVEPIKIPKIKEFCEEAKVKVEAKSHIPAPALPIPTYNNSSATIVRSTPARRIPGKIVNNNAVKRTATITKRTFKTPASQQATPIKPVFQQLQQHQQNQQYQPQQQLQQLQQPQQLQLQQQQQKPSAATSVKIAADALYDRAAATATDQPALSAAMNQLADAMEAIANAINGI